MAIDYLNNSKSVFGAFSKQQQGALKVCLSAFSVNIIPMQHKWNVNAEDIMMTWFILYVNLC